MRTEFSMNNQRGGIISKLFILPMGVALMVGFFFLGYFVGKYQSKPFSPGDKPATLPEIATQYIPKKDEFTFYKTLTEKEGKTVSIDLKPNSPAAVDKPAKKTETKASSQEKNEKQPKQEKQLDIKIEKPASAHPREPAPKPVQAQPQQAKKEPAPKPVPTPVPDTKIRYTIQIAAYPEREMADEEVKGMKKRGYAAFIVSSEVPEKGTWYRVRLGSFSNKASAEKLMNELRAKEGLNPFITIE